MLEVACLPANILCHENVVRLLHLLGPDTTKFFKHTIDILKFWTLVTQQKVLDKKCRPNIWPWGYKTFLCSTQLNMKILLIGVKMPTIVGIITFISRINTSYESFKARNTYLFQHFSFYEQLKFYAQLSMKFFLYPRSQVLPCLLFWHVFCLFDLILYVPSTIFQL